MPELSRNGIWKFLLNRPVLNFIMALLGLTAAYYTTIGSIKIQLADKAEGVLVETIDRKLTELEVLIREGMVTKDQFYEFKTGIDYRLGRIEYYLQFNQGE